MIGETPAHWEIRRNGRLFAQRNETGFAALPILEVSLRTGVRLREFSMNVPMPRSGARAYLRRYKKEPCALAAHAMPPMQPEQQAMVDLIIGVDPETMTDGQRLRLASMVAAYAGVQFTSVSVVSVSPANANSTRVRLQLPEGSADALLRGVQSGDPLLKAFLEDLPVLRAERVTSGPRRTRTDTSEKGLETLIVSDLLEAGWIAGDPKDYDREYAVDLKQLEAFLAATQPQVVEAADLANAGPVRQKFLARLQGEVSKRGVIDVIRSGVKHGAHHIDVFYGTPSPRNVKAAERNTQNRFSVTRQLRYSHDEASLALDMALFINGLPVATFELKNSLTKQTVQDAIEQYQRDRDPRERLLNSGVVSFIWPWMITRSAFAPNSKARPRGSRRSTRATMTAPAIRQIPTD
jgi:type I restriction enzyme R subunit